ncbi:MAG: DNA polymerase Y family protein [Planctomycetota bacterium]
MKTDFNSTANSSTANSSTPNSTPETGKRRHSLMLHVDIDAFFASVEQIRNPRLAGRPVAVGSGVIASCSYEARKHGLRAGMPLGRAVRRCPTLIIVRGRESVYRAYARQLFDLCETLSPRLEEHLDEAYCDLSGTEKLFPDPVAEAQRLCQQVTDNTGLTVTVGLGRNRMFARLIGRQHKPNGIGLLDPTQEDTLLRALPIIELPGIGPRSAERLQRLGIATVDELRQLTLPTLSGLFGRQGEILFQRCRGEDHRSIGGREVPRTLQRGTSFDEDVACPRTLDAMLEYLTERAALELRRRGLLARGLTVQIAYSDHIRDRRRLKLHHPCQDDPTLITTALGLRGALQQRRTAVRFIGVILDGIHLVPEASQPELFPTDDNPGESSPTCEEPQQQKWQKLLPQVDRIRERHGHGLLLRGSALALQQESESQNSGHNTPPIRRDRQGLILRTSCLTR